jgi:hypothetical protein
MPQLPGGGALHEADASVSVVTLGRSHPASEAEIGDLARARTQAIRDALLGPGTIDARRVFVLGIKPVASIGGKARVELSLK